MHISGDFGCYSTSGIRCEGTCKRISPGCFDLTKDEPHTNGYLWSSKKLNVSLPFSIEVTINAGFKNEGAEGFVFVLQDESTSTVGFKGEGVGFQGISPSFGISFDTHHNPYDETAEDHISFHKDGKIAELCNQHVNLTNIEDDSDHKMIIIWDPSTN